MPNEVGFFGRGDKPKRIDFTTLDTEKRFEDEGIVRLNALWPLRHNRRKQMVWRSFFACSRISLVVRGEAMISPDRDEYVHVARPIHPDAEVPDDLKTIVWRYMNWWKFEALVLSRGLYLRRLDLLQDRFEGQFSPWQIADTNQWLQEQGHGSQVEVERQRREKWRKQSFVNCWCMSNYELELLWRGYACRKEAVAIQSRISKLKDVCDQADTFWPLDVSVVKYVDHQAGAFIEYADGFAPAVRKDHFYELDREVRIIHCPNIGAPPDHVCLSVNDLGSLIERVVLVPGASAKFAERVVQLLKENKLSVPIEHSRGDAEPLS